MSEQITANFTRDEFILIWNCVWAEIINRQNELEIHSCDGVRSLLTELYAVEKKLKQLHTPPEVTR